MTFQFIDIFVRPLRTLSPTLFWMRGAALAFISLLASRASCRRWPECCTRRIRVNFDFLSLEKHCSDTKANRRKTAPKINWWISKSRFFDWFANENFLVLSTFVCMPAALLVFIWLLASRPSVTACAECTARRIRDEVELKQTDRNSKYWISNFRNFEINQNNWNLWSCFTPI